MKEYVGSVYVGVVGAELEVGECRDSINKIRRREGDEMFYHRATKGYECRQAHYRRWREQQRHAFMCLLDADMVFPPDTIERLRSHKLPFVSGFYMRRSYQPLTPVWYVIPKDDKWPHEPFMEIPEPDKLYELGASGWGCALLHQEVADAVEVILKNEWAIMEDDMDIWPYDLERLMIAVQGIRELVENKPPARMLRAALKEYSTILSEEIRPLRAGKHDIVGSDVRYGFYARKAGYTLMGDGGLICGHMANYPLTLENWKQADDEYRGKVAKEWRKHIDAERQKVQSHLNNLIKAGQ